MRHTESDGWLNDTERRTNRHKESPMACSIGRQRSLCVTAAPVRRLVCRLGRRRRVGTVGGTGLRAARSAIRYGVRGRLFCRPFAVPAQPY